MPTSVRRLPAVAIVVVALLVTLATVEAATNEWDASVGSGAWEVASNWAVGSVPATVDTVYLRGDASYTVTVSGTTSEMLDLHVGTGNTTHTHVRACFFYYIFILIYFFWDVFLSRCKNVRSKHLAQPTNRESTPPPPSFNASRRC